MSECAEGTATLSCVIIDPDTGAGEWASAGHPPPLLVGPEGAAVYLEAGPNQQPALGVGTEPVATHGELAVAPGEMLPLYTDGLIERSDRADVAVLALRRTPPSESVLGLRPRAVSTAARDTRRRLGPWLAAHSFDPQAASDALVAVSEAVAEQVTVRARLGSGRLEVTIRDTGRRRPARVDPLRGFGLNLMRSLMDTVKVDQRGDGTRVELTPTPDSS